jgi:phenylpropionate dioxygenase-like ring-hydroxylating dioxygenase large terminal subunit
MDHQTQVEQAHRLFRYLDTGTTSERADIYRNPVTDYTCVEQATREREILFRQYPLLVGLSCEVTAPGDYLSDDFSGVPIVVVRDDDGLHAWMNVCKHRGSRLAQGCGQGKKSFSCPYHGWTYQRNGQLQAIPFESGFAGIDKSQHNLTSLPVVEKYGMVWVLPTSGRVIDIDRQLESLARDLAAYRFDGYSHYETRVLEAHMNWKLVVDTFLETYHIPVLHQKTIAPIIHGNLGTFDAMGQNLRMIGARRTIENLRTQPEAEWDFIRHTAVVYVLFPNTVLVMQGDHLETWRVYPGASPDESKMHVSLYTPTPADSDKAKRYWDRNMDLLLATVQKEDFPLAENAQRDFHTDAQQFLTFGKHEPSLAHFHSEVRAAISGRGR